MCMDGMAGIRFYGDFEGFGWISHGNWNVWVLLFFWMHNISAFYILNQICKTISCYIGTACNEKFPGIISKVRDMDIYHTSCLLLHSHIHHWIWHSIFWFSYSGSEIWTIERSRPDGPSESGLWHENASIRGDSDVCPILFYCQTLRYISTHNLQMEHE